MVSVKLFSSRSFVWVSSSLLKTGPSYSVIIIESYLFLIEFCNFYWKLSISLIKTVSVHFSYYGALMFGPHIFIIVNSSINWHFKQYVRFTFVGLSWLCHLFIFLFPWECDCVDWSPFLLPRILHWTLFKGDTWKYWAVKRAYGYLLCFVITFTWAQVTFSDMELHEGTLCSCFLWCRKCYKGIFVFGLFCWKTEYFFF